MVDDEKIDLARDLMRDLMAWEGEFADLKKKFEMIENSVMSQFGGHLARGYITDIDKRYRNIRKILGDILQD